MVDTKVMDKEMNTMEVENFRVENTMVEAVVVMESRVDIVLVMNTKVVVDSMVEVTEVVVVINTEVLDTRWWIQKLWIQT